MRGVVTVAQGRIRGVWRGDLWSFSGIPYARAPLGELRWRPPQSAEGWAGIRDTSAFGPIAPQRDAVLGAMSAMGQPGEEQSEDCLSLNVWTRTLPDAPACRAAAAR